MLTLSLAEVIVLVLVEAQRRLIEQLRRELEARVGNRTNGHGR